MAPQPRPWKKSLTGVVDSSGSATVTIVPGPAGLYDIDTTTVSLSGNTAKNVVCRIYRDSVAQLNQQDATKSGEGDTSNTIYHLQGGDVVIAVWTGATPGAIAGIRIAGIYTPES